MFNEAVDRMKLLKLESRVISDFKKGKLYISDDNGSLQQEVPSDYLKLIKMQEKKYNIIVYYAVFSISCGYNMLNLLYVSDEKDEYKDDRHLLKTMSPYVHVINLDVPEFSEVGRISLSNNNKYISRTN